MFKGYKCGTRNTQCGIEEKLKSKFVGKRLALRGLRIGSSVRRSGLGQAWGRLGGTPPPAALAKLGNGRPSTLLRSPHHTDDPVSKFLTVRNLTSNCAAGGCGNAMVTNQALRIWRSNGVRGDARPPFGGKFEAKGMGFCAGVLF